jgi:urease accessory protein
MMQLSWQIFGYYQAMIKNILRAALLTAGAAPLFAHAEGHLNEMGSSTAASMGFLHPMLGWDHLLAMVTVGALGASLGGRHRYALPGTFLGALVIGGLVALAGVPLIGGEWVISSSVLVLGAYLAWAAVPLNVMYGTVALAAMFHGHAHLAEMPAGAGVLAYGAGMLLATGLLHGLGSAAGHGLQRWTHGVTLRIAGGAIAAGGAILMGVLALG